MNINPHHPLTHAARHHYGRMAVSGTGGSAPAAPAGAPARAADTVTLSQAAVQASESAATPAVAPKT